MKKVFMVALGALCLATIAKAQDDTSASTSSKNDDTALMYIEYLGLGLDGVNGFSFGAQMPSKYHLDIGADFNWTEGADETSFRGKLGGLLGWWIGDVAFISGSVGAFIGGSDGGFLYGLFASPRIALKLGESFCITGSYRYDFSEFKFDSDYGTDYFTVGIGFTLPE